MRTSARARSTSAALALAMLAMLGTGCSAKHPQEPPPVANRATDRSDDAVLVARVRDAVAAGAPVETLAARVGRKPAIDTTAGYPLEALRGVDITPDPEHPAETLFGDATAVVYWVRPIEAKDPRIVGVQVNSDGKPRVFYGVVLPP